MLNRRALYRWGAVALGNAFALSVAIPGLRYLLDPLGKSAEGGQFRPMTRLSQLKAGEPQAFSVIAKRQDSWVRYPPEPVGSVWLVRQPDGAEPKVLGVVGRVSAPELPGQHGPQPPDLSLSVPPGEFSV